MRLRAAIAFIAAASCGGPHRYTCPEILGPHPRAGHIAILPPGYSFAGAFVLLLLPDEHPAMRPVADFSVWDETGRQICDANGKDIPR